MDGDEIENMEESSFEASDEDESSDFDDDSSDDDGEDVPMMSNPSTGGNQLSLLASFLAQVPPAEANDEPDVVEPEMAQQQLAPEEVWQNHLADVATSSTKSLKVSDDVLEWFFHMLDQLQNNEPVDVAVDIDKDGLFASLKDAMASNTGLTHVIFGTKAWRLFGSGQQSELLQMAKRHASTLKYWKMGSGSGSEDSGPLGGPSVTETLLHALVTTEWKFTELEFRGLYLHTPQHVRWFQSLLKQTPTLKQVNMLNFYLDPALYQPSRLDPILEIATQMNQLDELRLCRCANTGPPVPALISPEAWQTMLEQKPKWWRLAMDGLGFDDRHGLVLTTALQSSPQCKMGDVLSLRHNPNLHDYGSIMRACFCKQRMGEVSVDDQSWVATFHLVRSMNNLHRRLDYVLPDSGGYPSRDRWIEWLAVLGNIGWQDDAHRVNYLWFTLLEQPDFLKPPRPTTTQA